MYHGGCKGERLADDKCVRKVYGFYELSTGGIDKNPCATYNNVDIYLSYLEEDVMPPKVKIPREAIIEKAFELTKVYGFEKVTARLLASELKCSTQPVFHAFRNMEELKEEVYKKTQKLFEETMLQQPSDTETPYFLSMGIKYIELAQNEKNLFHLLCMSDSGTRLESLYDLAKHVPVPIEPEVFVKTWIFTHGIATIVSTNTTNIAPEEIRQLLIEACASFKLYHDENKEGSANDKV